ncbi:RNA-binding protein [Strigomonas culicis]|uniref:RNA-binding protein n=1 Tax=Strigomonas culicis TaxID=28005 RepID=S9WD17_9TRYP|nr:RNA-binding protein [Strigomonas culicis]EPY37031.1 RNA-binding protein [Strigomonas culicis]|eukprot:EPY34664.1 RNA-binding protein [Strigomonas culicis]
MEAKHHPTSTAAPPAATAAATARLFVGQLNFDAAEHDIRQLFAFYGHVLHVNILRDEDGKSSGSAFVTYGSTAEADMAILSLHNRYNMGRERPLQVSYCRRSEQISDFGYQHAVELQKQNKSNPLPPQRAA